MMSRLPKLRLRWAFAGLGLSLGLAFFGLPGSFALGMAAVGWALLSVLSREFSGSEGSGGDGWDGSGDGDGGD